MVLDLFFFCLFCLLICVVGFFGGLFVCLFIFWCAFWFLRIFKNKSLHVYRVRQMVDSPFIRDTLTFVCFSDTKLSPGRSDVEDTHSSLSELAGNEDQGLTSAVGHARPRALHPIWGSSVSGDASPE